MCIGYISTISEYHEAGSEMQPQYGTPAPPQRHAGTTQWSKTWTNAREDHCMSAQLLYRTSVCATPNQGSHMHSAGGVAPMHGGKIRPATHLVEGR